MVDEALEQPKPRKDLVVGSVNDDEKALIEQARVKAGKPNMSVFVRETMLNRARHILAPKRATDQEQAA